MPNNVEADRILIDKNDNNFNLSNKLFELLKIKKTRAIQKHPIHSDYATM